jgi:hypothetical protein
MRRLSHGASLPLSLGLSHPDTTLKIVDDNAEMANQLLLLSLYRRNKLLVTGTAAAPLERWQGRKGPDIAIAKLAPETLHTANSGGLPPQMARGIVEMVALPAGDSDFIAKVDVPTAALALWAFEPRPTNALHRLVPDDRNSSFADPKIARVDGQPAAPVPPMGFPLHPFQQSPALVQRPYV